MSDPAGSVVALWRYPVKSMAGEELESIEVTKRGLRGDRAYAVVDSADGKAATAKNPRKWPKLFEFHASLVEPVANAAGAAAGRNENPMSVPTAASVAPVRISLPDGNIVLSNQEDLDQVLSTALSRGVTLQTVNPGGVKSEQYWPDMDEFDLRDTVTEFTLPEGTFFDCAMVHLLTTATLDRLQELYPEGRFEVRRFRPNIVVQPSTDRKGFAENEWVGHTVAIGPAVRLNITGPAGRCVMTTLAQGDLPKDPGILRTAARHNGVNVGVYARVERGGTIRRGDRVVVE